MDKKYEYAVSPMGGIIFRGVRLFRGPAYELFYKGVTEWQDEDDFFDDEGGNVDWIVSEEEALQAALKLGMTKENFYK